MSLHLQAATAEPVDPDRLLGQIMRHMVDQAQGEGAGERFRDLITQATRPATPERRLQDRAWSLLAARLHKLAAEQAGGTDPQPELAIGDAAASETGIAA